MNKTWAHIKINKKELLFYASIFSFSIFIFASVLIEPLKYLKYTLPLLLFVVLLVFSKRIFIRQSFFQSNRRFQYLIGLMTFYSIACIINVFKGFASLRFYEEFYFVFSPLIFAFLLLLLRPVEDYTKAVCFLFWAITISFVAEKFQFFLEEIKNPLLLKDAFLTSDLPTESNFAFQFGLFLIVFLAKKQRMYSLIALLMLLLSFKRIAIAGVLVFLLLALVRKLSGQRLNPAGSKTLILLFNCIVVFLLFLFFNGIFDRLVEDTLGVSSNFISQGRYNIYQDIFAHYGRISILGFGLGSINLFLSTTGYQLVNLHSDVLKVFFELGPVLFFSWIYFFHRWANTFLSSCLAIYINILFLTDNVFIYFDVMFVFYILMIYSFHTETKMHPKHFSRNPAPSETNDQNNTL